jgi:hypothetical protein
MRTPSPVGTCLVRSYGSSQPMGLWGRGRSCAVQAHPICAQVAQSPGGRRSASATSHRASHMAQHTKCAHSSALSTCVLRERIVTRITPWHNGAVVLPTGGHTGAKPVCMSQSLCNRSYRHIGFGITRRWWGIFFFGGGAGFGFPVRS